MHLWSLHWSHIYSQISSHYELVWKDRDISLRVAAHDDLPTWCGERVCTCDASGALIPGVTCMRMKNSIVCKDIWTPRESLFHNTWPTVASDLTELISVVLHATQLLSRCSFLCYAYCLPCKDWPLRWLPAVLKGAVVTLEMNEVW